MPHARRYIVLALLLWLGGVITLVVGLGEWVDRSVSSLAADFAGASGVLSTIEVGLGFRVMCELLCASRCLAGALHACLCCWC